MTSSAASVRRELRKFNESSRDVDPSTLPLKTMLWRVLIEPLEPRKESEGGILLDATADAQEILTTVGRIVQLGSFAYKSKTQAGLNLDEEENKPAVGDYVLYAKYTGQDIRLRNGKKLLILSDTEILAIVTDPDQIKIYI